MHSSRIISWPLDFAAEAAASISEEDLGGIFMSAERRGAQTQAQHKAYSRASTRESRSSSSSSRETPTPSTPAPRAAAASSTRRAASLHTAPHQELGGGRQGAGKHMGTKSGSSRKSTRTSITEPRTTRTTGKSSTSRGLRAPLSGRPPKRRHNSCQRRVG